MGNAVFVEGKEFFAWCGADRAVRQGWTPTIVFERKSDYGQPEVKAVKHTLKVSFPEENEAIQAAISFADERMARGDVGL